MTSILIWGQFFGEETNLPKFFRKKNQYTNIWVFPKIVVPQNEWFIMEILSKMDDLGVPLFSETPIFTKNNVSIGGFANVIHLAW